MGDQVLRTGVLFKKGSGGGPFGRKNWKPRFFVLTPAKLRYYTFEDGDLKGEVSLTGCNEGMLEVMPSDSMKTGSSASTIWRIAINSPERRLLVAAGTEMEMNDWVDKLVMAFRINSGQPLEPPRESLSPPVSDGLPRPQSITDFQNFAPAARRTGPGNRHSMASNGGHEFRMSEDVRSVQREAVMLQQQRQLQEEQRHHAEDVNAHQELMLQQQQEAEEARAFELEQQRIAQQMKQMAEDQERQHTEALQEQLRQEKEHLLEMQRRLKRDKHERDRQEREQRMHEQEAQERESQTQMALQAQFDNDFEEHYERSSYHQQQQHHLSPSMAAMTINSPAGGRNSHSRSPVRNSYEQQQRSAYSPSAPRGSYGATAGEVEIVRRAPAAPANDAMRPSLRQDIESVEF